MAGERQRIGWRPYFYLVYLGMLLFQPIFGDGGLRDWLWTVLLIAAFVPAYFASFRNRGRSAALPIGWMVLLGVLALAFPLNTGGSVFFVYAAAAAPFAWSTGTTVRFLAGVLALVAVLALVSPEPMSIRLANFLPALIFVPLIGGVQIFEAERERSNAKLRLAQEEVERFAAVAERERIGRDLHDLLGHTLSVIRVKSELAGRLLEVDPKRAQAEIEAVERTAREALTEVRAAVQGYRSSGLIGEVVSAKLALEAAGVAFTFRSDPRPLPARIETALGFVLREAATNVLRHAEASRCSATLELDRGWVVLSVLDDGVGGAAIEGNGLSNLRERIRALGGSVSLGPEPGGGFAMRARVPHEAHPEGRSASVHDAGSARIEAT